MSTRLIRSSAAWAVVAAAAVTGPAARAADAGRPAKQVQADLQAVDKQLAAKPWPAGDVYNPLFRQQMAREYGGLYAEQEKLLVELGQSAPKLAAATRHLALMDDARLAYFGDADAQGRVDAAVASEDKATAVDGKVAAAALAWWQAGPDADAAAKAVDDVDALVAAAPTSPSVAGGIYAMLQVTPDTVALGQRLTADLIAKGKTPAGKAYAAVPNKIDEPLAIDGTQLSGRAFKSSAWAGKVVLVDFWATWCPPCREEIPHVVKMYQQYHDQGLEIIGVSSDNDKRTMAAFLKATPDMAWPELFGSTTGWHPLTKKFGISSIPTMYLIDRNGVLRTLEARSQMDKLIPELLAEPYAPPAAKAKAGSPAAHSPTGTSSITPPGGVPNDAVQDALHRAAGATMH